MNALLVRVGADKSVGGGLWNGPVDSQTGEFAYVSIPESREVHPGLEKPYTLVIPALEKFGIRLPVELSDKRMHLDPDFKHLTYGDTNERAKQIRKHLQPGDIMVFYSGLKDVRGATRLVYAIIGIFTVEKLALAGTISDSNRDINAHSRRLLDVESRDIVVFGRAGESGRLKHCLAVGDFRDRAYRVRRDLLEEWGGLSVKDGYLQRSARLPLFCAPDRFLRWLDRQKPNLIQANN